MKRLLGLTFCLHLAVALQVLAQSGVIRGSVVSAVSNQPVAGASVRVLDTKAGAITRPDGSFEIRGLSPGLYNLEVTSIGYKNQVVFEIEVTNARPALIEVRLEEEAVELEGVEVGPPRFVQKIEESPLSLRSIGTAEIKRSPGANRDISRVIQTLPGAATTVSFRNDIIIRGGAPNENRFYLDGIEVPNINHFATQGSSGGPVGLLNVDLITGVDFYSGAFPANRGNALSSVFEFRQKEGRDDQFAFNGVVGASDLGVTVDGPLSDNSSLIVSARRSYLQFLFEVIGLPFLPTYNDAQFKYQHTFDSQNRLSIIGLGAIDDFELNLDADDTETKRYLLNFLPIQTQWNYTLGARFDHFREDGFYTFILSRNELNNDIVKYENNDDSSPQNLTLDYESREIENKFRFEDFRVVDSWKFTYGLRVEHARYSNNTFNRIATREGPVTRRFETELNINKWSLFGQASTRLFDERLLLSLGVRADANDYSDAMNSLFDQVSPRFSAAYYLSESVSLNFNSGLYYQLPSYTVMGYRDSESGALTNKDKGLKYIRTTHLVAGLEYVSLNSNAKLSLEGFYKNYDNYPFLLVEQVSLANLGGDFGVIGNDPVSSSSDGRAYGVELLGQLRATDGFYGIAAYTFMRSEFSDGRGILQPSAWDFRHIVSMTGGKVFDDGWEIGLRWSFYSEAPFTPFDVEASLRRENWDVRGRGIEDYERVNAERVPAFHQLDLRIDKKFFFDTWSLTLYFDIQNAYGFETVQQDYLDVERDESGAPIVDPADPDRYLVRFIENTSNTVLPTLGAIFEF